MAFCRCGENLSLCVECSALCLMRLYTFYSLQATGYRLQSTGYRLHDAWYISLVLATRLNCFQYKTCVRWTDCLLTVVLYCIVLYCIVLCCIVFRLPLIGACFAFVVFANFTVQETGIQFIRREICFTTIRSGHCSCVLNSVEGIVGELSWDHRMCLSLNSHELPRSRTQQDRRYRYRHGAVLVTPSLSHCSCKFSPRLCKIIRQWRSQPVGGSLPLPSTPPVHLWSKPLWHVWHI
jgi:hypothetical protein